MKLNEGKYHLLVSGHKYENVWVKMKEEKIWKSAKQKILWKGIGRNLDLDDYMTLLWRKAGRKLAVFERLEKFKSLKQKQILMKTFVESEFGYCPVI